MVGNSISAISTRGRQSAVRPWLGTLLVALCLMLSRGAGAALLRADVTVSTSGGYARLVFALAAPDYIGAARLDPDGTAVRLALNRKVTVNSMAVGERFYVDLLPEDWTGLPPGLPR